MLAIGRSGLGAIKPVPMSRVAQTARNLAWRSVSRHDVMEMRELLMGEVKVDESLMKAFD